VYKAHQKTGLIPQNTFLLKINIIGSGVAGMASAVRLSALGHEVAVHEANAYEGGKLSEKWLGKYRFDVGPSVFTLPNLVDDLFAFSKKENTLRYKKLDVTCVYFWEDGTVITGYAEPDAFADEIAAKTGIAASTMHAHFAYTQNIYKHTKSLHRFKSFASLDIVRSIANIGHLDLFTTMHEANTRRLKHPKLVQMFDRYATFNGSSPYLAPGILNVIPHLEHGIGVFAPEGGMNSITKAMVGLAKANGASFHLNSPVERILHQNKTVSGVQINGQALQSDAVLTNMDVYPTYKQLLQDEKNAAKELKQKRSLSAVVFYWGVKQSFDNLHVHNTLFSENYKEEFEILMNQENVGNDPTIYINIGSKYAPDDAPEGCETWFVMVNAPANNGKQDWDEIVARTRKNVVAKINRILKIDIESLMEEEMHFDPRIIEARNRTFAGSIYGTSSNDRMAAFFRHPNFAPDYKNLYFAGVAAHPGGGIPLCLLSAKIACEMINERG
jgi:phytoene desaturase